MKGLKNLPGEIWKDIPGYEGYYVASNKGRIFSIKTGKLLKFNCAYTTLVKDGVKRTKRLSRLIYQTFFGTINGCIDFKDGNPHNIELDNLISDKVIQSRIPKLKYQIGCTLGRFILISRNGTSATIQCKDCGDKLTLSTTMLNQHNHNHKCSCYFKYRAGDIINNYEIIENNGGFLTYKCLSCNSIIKNASTNRLQFKHNCDAAINSKYYGAKRKNLIYKRYKGIKSRCSNQNSTYFISYGAKNIFLCDFWNNSFLEFYLWYRTELRKAQKHFSKYEVLYIKGKLRRVKMRYDIDRINPTGPYAPWNCRVIPRFINRNKQFNIIRSKYFPETGELRKLNDRILRKDRYNWYKKALKEGLIDVKYFKSHITGID